MTQPIFTTRECELLDEALGAFSDTYGEALSDDAATELEELGFKIWRLGPEKQCSPQTEVRVCPGWGEECGNKTEGNADLCADCRMARLDTQSPRIPL